MRNYEEKEEVKVVHKSSEVQTKEFEKAAKRLANANLVLLLNYLNLNILVSCGVLRNWLSDLTLMRSVCFG